MKFKEVLNYRRLKFDHPNLIKYPENAKNILPYVLRFPFPFIEVIPLEVRLKEKEGHNLINPLLDQKAYNQFKARLYEMNNCYNHELLVQDYTQMMIKEPVKRYKEIISGYCIHCGEYFHYEKNVIDRFNKAILYRDHSSRKKGEAKGKEMKNIKLIDTASRIYKQTSQKVITCSYYHNDLEYETLFNDYQNKLNNQSKQRSKKYGKL